MKLGRALVIVGMMSFTVILAFGVGGLIKGGHSFLSSLYLVLVVASAIGWGLIYWGIKRINKNTKKSE